MTESEYNKCKKDHQAIEMIRPFWDYSFEPNPKDVTVLICHGFNRWFIQLTGKTWTQQQARWKWASLPRWIKPPIPQCGSN